MTKVLVGDTEYPSKKAALERARKIRDRYIETPNVPISDEVEVRFIDGLLSLHPGAERKRGAGVSYFYVGRNGGTFCFWIKRTDGTVVDFSMTACFSTDGALNRRQQIHAFRYAIDDQVERFRNQAFGQTKKVQCALSVPPMMITKEEAHVDHFPPFSKLMDQFLDMIGVESVEVYPGGMSNPPKIKDPKILAAWQKYHEENAKLRVIHWRKNVSMGNRATS